MFKKVSYPSLFILIALSFMLSGFSGCGPIINKQPADTTVAVGGVAYFSVGAIGLNLMNYQWEKKETAPDSDWTAVSGATYSTLTIPAVALEDDGAKFRCLVTNIIGQSKSREAVLTVAKRIYVDSAASGGDNGTSWASAYTDLQNALARAAAGFEIWIAKGTYKPTSNSDETISFVMVEGVDLYGGFAGNETELEQRKWVNGALVNETILSGDIGAVDDYVDNSSHVVVGANNAILDGFIIKDGYANDYESPRMVGGGMLNDNASPKVFNCTFSNNRAFAWGGAGMACNNNSSPAITNCAFINNYSGLDDGGGGLLIQNNSNPKVTNCSFIGNGAYVGGGIGVRINSNPNITSCIFSNNNCEAAGGIWITQNSKPIITNSVFFDNTGYTFVGAIAIIQGSSSIITNCTIVKNHCSGAGDVGGVFGNAQITNCIIWGNYKTDGSIGDDVEMAGSGLITNCAIRNAYDQNGIWNSYYGTDGGGNIDPDSGVLFVDADNDNFQLQSTSPCINAGDNQILDYLRDDKKIEIPFDLAGNPHTRIVGSTVDMGAYEYQGQ